LKRLNYNIFLSIFVICSIVKAEPVNIEIAQLVAGNIFAERSSTGSSDGFNIHSIEILERVEGIIEVVE